MTPLHPHILQLSHVMDSHVSERVKNKVYQLARQYSLRIKSRSVTARPPLHWEKVASTAPLVQEEVGAPSGGTGTTGWREGPSHKPELGAPFRSQMASGEVTP